jgi:hypothetical protein
MGFLVFIGKMMETIWIETEFARVHGRLSGPPHAPLLLGIHGWSRRNGWHTWEPLHAPWRRPVFAW